MTLSTLGAARKIAPTIGAEEAPTERALVIPQGASIPDPRMWKPELLHRLRTPVNKLKINWKNKLAKNLKFFGVVVPGGLYDIVGRKFYNLPNATIRTYPTLGLVAEYNGTTQDILTIPDIIIDNGDARSMTVAGCFYRVGNGVTNLAPVAFFSKDYAATYHLGFRYGFDHYHVACIGRGSSNATYNTQQSGPSVFGVPIVCSGTFLNSYNINEAQTLGYANRVLSDPDVEALYGGSFTNINRLGMSGYPLGPSERGECGIRFMALWDDKWDAVQHITFQNDPYQFLVPA